ncbi:MAG: VOC family protein [Dehalococcoidia bacterium]
MPGPDLGTFSLSLTVRDLAASRAFYEHLGFEVIHGVAEEGWLILQSGEAKIGLFQGMFEKNLITFNPADVRAIQRHLEAHGVAVELMHGAGEDGDPAGAGGTTAEEGPAHFMLTDPDGNQLLFDQF